MIYNSLLTQLCRSGWWDRFYDVIVPSLEHTGWSMQLWTNRQELFKKCNGLIIIRNYKSGYSCLFSTKDTKIPSSLSIELKLLSKFSNLLWLIIKSMKNESGNIHQKLAQFLLSYCRTTPHTTTHETPAKLFIGRELRTRLTALKPNLANSIKKRTNSLNNKFRTLEVGCEVLVRDYRIHIHKEKYYIN